MVKCHKCGHDNDEGHEFCEECGTKLKAELKCRKCGHHLKPDDDFCEECGAKVKESKVAHHEHKTGNKLAKYKWWLIGAGIFIIIATIFVFAIPLSYTAKEGYTEKVPYDTQETYTEKEPYEYNSIEGFDYQIDILDKQLFMAAGGWIVQQSFQLSNKENTDGCWQIYATLYANYELISGRQLEPICVPGKTTRKFEVSIYSGVQSSEPKPWIGAYTISLQRIDEPKKSVTKTGIRDVEKTRTVTKYKDKYKERFVTKYATLFQQWSGQAKYYYKVE